ncbi:Hypothetical protein Nlim_1293 [Candidatus Nitrosarchaeum limnium SFB1]|jgi:hypothetical protein|uniref:TIR domain-containing protein n=1 Tax=Candidatus Nitrosarchaeum limnium SFB1 TaxID=886738 RepID=F3KLB3_9ARCH|nr:Hypothetical protein Nlim_1293 [Candidatus Nitrosarchaeum limnium SFB1]
MKKILENIGHVPILEEFINPKNKLPIPYEEIRNKVELSDYVFLFLTDNVVKTEYTKNWVIYEDGVASAKNKKIFVFERQGTSIPYPIPYVTSYALFDLNSTTDMLEIQSLSKSIGKFRKDLATGAAGAAVGSVFGPVGMILGAIAGYMIGPKPKKQAHPKCNICNVSFDYYSPHIKEFNCPCCRNPMSYSEDDSINKGN